MERIVEKLVQEFEQGKLSRRQLIQSLTVAATAVSAVGTLPARAAQGKVFNATNINHVSYQVTDYARTRDFYVGLFGMKITADDGQRCRLVFGNNILAVRNYNRPGEPHVPNHPAPNVDHIAYTIPNWDTGEKQAVEAELTRRGIKYNTTTVNTSIDILDPEGFTVQIGGEHQ